MCLEVSNLLTGLRYIIILIEARLGVELTSRTPKLMESLENLIEIKT